MEPVRLWLVGAVAGAASLWLPRGPFAVVLATVYGLAAAALALHAVRLRLAWRERIALVTALVSPAIAAGALIAERAGHRLFGFELGVLTLTVAHFHFAGFAAALIAGLHRRLAPGRPADTAVLAVPTGTLLVLAGYFTSEFVELAGALVLTAGMWAMGWSTWRHARTRVADRLTATLLAVSAVVLAASMALAVSWALGEATGLPHPSPAWMAATHGVANALGFAVCGLAAYTRLQPRTAEPEPTLAASESTASESTASGPAASEHAACGLAVSGPAVSGPAASGAALAGSALMGPSAGGWWRWAAGR
ncbi:YndJ family protein [Paractinoplanes deccanensis]|uniref:YndJ family protein n=1 Tax=Paractinoplanes deccanensis TaxID=113561 RepID=UPI001EF197B1|nr:YndJ family protein [Actinoplanes deccanensis]